ncbi:MAG: DUF6056 family protein [Flavobacteriales bacterium]
MERRTVFRIFLLLLTVSLLKHAWLARYCHPMADDWSYAYQGQAFRLLPWLQGEYLNWNGRYFSNILIGQGPLVLGLDALWLYRSVPVLLMLLTVVGAYAFVRSISRGVLSRSDEWTAALLFFALFIQGMPDIREGFYWYTGAITYQLGNILALFHAARVLRSQERTWASTVVDALLLAIVMGCSEVHMILMVVFHGLLITWRWRRGATIRKNGLWLLAVALLCTVAVVLAPGNAVRSALFTGTHDPLHSLWMSALQSVRFGLTWMSNPVLLLLSFLYIPAVRSFAQRSPLFAKAFHLKPWMSTLALPAIIFLCAFPAYWGTGILGQHRTVNVAYFFFLPLWFINLTVWDVHVFQRKWVRWPRLTQPMLVGVLVAVLGFFNLYGNGGRASRDLVTGKAARFDGQVGARYPVLEQARENDDPIVLRAIADPPESLYLLELREDPNDWVNQCYALYFGVKGRPVIRAPAP